MLNVSRVIYSNHSEPVVLRSSGASESLREFFEVYSRSYLLDKYPGIGTYIAIYIF